MTHDTYYVVAHFEWVLLLTLVSVCLIAFLSIIRNQSTNARLHRLARLSVRVWAVGLTVTLGATLATRLVTFDAFMANPWVLQVINATITAGTFLMVLALVLTGITLLVALWAFLAPRSE